MQCTVSLVMTQQNMLSKEKFAVSPKICWISKKLLSAKKIDESAKWFSKYTLCQQKLAESTKCLVMTQQNMLSTQKFAVSAKIGWISKNMLCQQKNLTSQQNELIQQKYALLAKICWVSKNAWWRFNKRCWVSKICSTSKNQLIQQNTLCQQNFTSPQKSMVIIQQK